MTAANEEAAVGVIDDGAARLTAVDPTRSFVVQAPAGSGKTELLVRRFLALLATASRPEAVMAMTFTRKAAGEMRERIVEALREAHAGEPEQDDYRRERRRLAAAVLERDRSQGWALLDDPGRLQVYTIDSLCARLAGALPLLSRFGSRPRTVEDAAPYFQEAARRALARAGDGGEMAEALGVVLERSEIKLGVLERQIVAMLACREQWAKTAVELRDPKVAEQMIAGMEARFAEIMGETLGALAAGLPRALAAAACNVARLTRDNLEAEGSVCPWPTLAAADQLDGSLESMPAWRELRALLLTEKGTVRKSVTKKQGAPPKSEAKTAYLELLEAAASDSDAAADSFFVRLAGTAGFPDSPQLSEEGRRALLAFFKVLFHAYAELWEVFRESSSVDFPEVALRAIRALGDPQAPSDLLERLDRRVEHLLVDEFQDTNLLQCDLIQCLTAGWGAADGRTLFLVGDPMQSIYRFRKAEVGLFLAAASDRELFPTVTLESLKLAVNFRSERSVIGWVNQCFAAAMGELDDVERGMVSYAASAPRPDAGEGESVRLIGWRSDGGGQADGNDAKGDGDDAEQGKLAEAEGLAALIEQELLPAARARGGGVRVAVLVRAKDHGTQLRSALRRRGIAYRAGSMDALDERAVVQDLRSLTRFLVHRGDRLCGLALLRSPLVGLSLEDLCSLVEPDVVSVAARDRRRREAAAAEQAEQAEQAEAGEGVASPTQNEPRPRPASVTTLLFDDDALGRVSEDGRRRLLRARDVLVRARRLLGRMALVRVVEAAWIELGGATTAAATELLDARSFFELLGEADEAAGLDFEELDRRLRRLTASADPDPEIEVEFLTMHGAKGLEFDTVVVPGLARRTNSGGDSGVRYETDPTSGRMTIAAPRPERGRSDPDEAKFKLLGAREAARDHAELLRLFYVAATRAKQCLVLSTPALAADDDGNLKPPRRASLLGALWESAERCYEERAARIDGGGDEPALTRVRADFALPDAPASVTDYLRTIRPSEATALSDDAEMTASRLPMQVGTVVHRWLERIARDGIDAWGGARLGEARARIARDLVSLGVDEDERERATTSVAAALSRTLGDDRGRWLLSRHDDDSYEWGLTRYGGTADAAEGDGERAGELTIASIDRSFVDEDGVRWIVDYKTGSVPFGRGPLKGLSKPDARARFLAERREHYHEQLQAYGRLVREVEPERPIMLALYFPQVDGGWTDWPYDA